jgi:uncharacterized protein (DUF1919 family)
MEQELELSHMDYGSVEYPVCMCGDIELYFSHYTSYESAVENWEKRKKG